MCEPATLIAGASLAISVGSKIVEAKAQKKQSNAVAANAEQSKVDTWKAISLQESQQVDATALTIMQTDRQARQNDAMTRVAAGESGVAGASVDALLGDLSRQASDFKVTQERNLNANLAQLQQEKKVATSQAQNRINAAPPPNPFAVGLTIAGMGASTAATLISRKPPKG